MASVAGGADVGATWNHDLANRRQDATLGNGLFTSFEYDLNDRLTRIKHARDVTTLFDIDYGYDEVGNRLWTRYNAAGDNNNLTDRSETYAYDNRDRLVSMSRGTMAAGSPTIQTPIDHNVLPSSQQWTNIDRRGNWREFSELFGSSPTGVTQARTVNTVNQYTGISLNGQPVTPALQHDAAGNLTLDPLAWNFWAGPGGLKYEYDEENRLMRVRIAVNDAPLLEIGYDAVGRRVETVEYWDARTGPLDPPRHTRHVYDGLQAVEEFECGTGVPTCASGWTLAREFIWGERFPEPIALVDHTAAGLLPASQPEVLHYLHDVLGSVIGLTNSAGTLVERYTYDPYGRTLVERRDPLTGSFELNGADGNFPTWSAFGNPFMWTGQRYDATVGLYHFKYRTYNPIWGRWHQQDPLGYVDGSNMYEYIRSDPLGWIDPLGLLAQATQPTSGPSSQPTSGPTSQPDGKKKCSKYSDDVFGETGGLRPQFKDPKDPKKDYDPKSEEELHKARKAVAEVAKNREEAKRKPPLHEKTPSDEELKNPHTKREWEKSKKAAEEAEKDPSLPKDAQHFYIRKGDKRGDDGKLTDRPGWAGHSDPYQSFGPFRNVGGGDVPKGDDIYIDVYKGVK